MNEALLQQHLGRHLFDQGHGWICGNFQTATLPECDLVSVNPRGLLCEWEIKLSRSDFKADTKKTGKHRALATGEGYEQHQRGKRLTLRLACCSYFSYVCPSGLLTLEDLPAYAGLVWVDPQGRVVIKRAAPIVHDYEPGAALLAKITHNLTQKYLYGCARRTFAEREALAPVPAPPAAPIKRTIKPVSPKIKTPAPPVKPKGRCLKKRTAIATRKKR